MTRYVIQRRSDRHYWTPAARWVPWADKARTFPSIAAATWTAYQDLDLAPEAWTVVAVTRRDWPEAA